MRRLVSEPVLVAHIVLLEIPCHGSFIVVTLSKKRRNSGLLSPFFLLFMLFSKGICSNHVYLTFDGAFRFGDKFCFPLTSGTRSLNFISPFIRLSLFSNTFLQTSFSVRSNNSACLSTSFKFLKPMSIMVALSLMKL